MTGFLILLGIVGATLGLLWAVRLRGPLLMLAAAALLFGAAGYALQGRPGLRGTPRTQADEPAAVPLTNARHLFFGTFAPGERWLIMADSYARSGDTRGAAQIVQAALAAHPNDPELWVGFGNALLDHSRLLTPAARFAFFRAIEIAPDSPAPRFFLGLALMRSGDSAGALAEWRAILAKAPKDAAWRPLVEKGVAVLDR